ncbi:MAG: PH domain-containing protein [Niabella sp.]|nr:MAG: PH domain-containing protein [Niabella sp.]
MINNSSDYKTIPFEKLFPSQQPNEKIVIAVREHWFRLVSKIFIIAILSLLPWVFETLIVGATVLDKSTTAMAIFNTLSSVYYLGLLVALFIVYILYYLNFHVVSVERIVDIDQTGLLFREVSELNIETIEDVTSQKKGLLGNLFNYGTVFVQTAGATERFEFHNIANPEEITSIILKLYEQHGDKERPKP